METWKKIKGYEGKYEVSDLGRVRSVDRWVPHPKPTSGKYFRKGVMLSIKNDCSKKNKHKWSRVQLCQDGKQKLHSLSELVYTNFVGDIMPKHIIHHLDGNPLNNKVSNLTQLTRSESMLRMREIHGYLGNRKLTFELAESFRARYKSGEKVKDMTKESGLCESTFRYMLKRVSYRR